MKIMKKVLIVLLLSSLGFNAHASFYEGKWCENFDDFRTEMTISSLGDVTRKVVGVETGYAHETKKGFISIGASGGTYVLNKEDQGRVEVLKTKSGKLIVDSENLGSEVFIKCD
jgi:hypothetical protein